MPRTVGITTRFQLSAVHIRINGDGTGYLGIIVEGVETNDNGAYQSPFSFDILAAMTTTQKAGIRNNLLPVIKSELERLFGTDTTVMQMVLSGGQYSEQLK